MATQGLSSCLLRSWPSPFRMSPIPVQCSFQPPIACTDMSNERGQHLGKTERTVGSCSLDSWSSISAFMDGKQRARIDASESLLGLSASLFNDENAFPMEKEDPPEYIPAPSQTPADLELSKKLESALYMLRELLPGPINKIGMDKQLLDDASRLVHVDVRIQDPLVCLQGKDKLWAWLHILAMAKAQVNLHDIYAERKIAPPCENCVYAIWTVSIPGELQLPLQPSTEKNSSELSLSGESKFEVDGNGQVISVESSWHMRRGGEEMLEKVKERLVSLFQKGMCYE